MILDAAETVIGYFGFDRSLYGNKKIVSKRKWRWFEELRQERERDIKIEATENSKKKRGLIRPKGTCRVDVQMI